MVELLTRRGHVIHLDPDDLRAQEFIRTRGDFNEHSVGLWSQLVTSRPWDLIVDVGANYGEMLLVVPPQTAATIVAFEPNTHLLPYLERTLAGADLAATLVPKAVGDHDGTATFVVDTTWSGTSHLDGDQSDDPEHDMVTQTVGMTTLDLALQQYPARSACIKIDVEGGEPGVLAGAERTFARIEQVAIMIEILHMTPEAVAELATRWRLHLYDERTRRLVRVPGNEPVHVAALLATGWLHFQDAILLPLSGDPSWRPW